jgi:hypothetical protein
MSMVNFTPWEKPPVPTGFSSSLCIHLNSKEKTGKLRCKALTGIATPKKQN